MFTCYQYQGDVFTSFLSSCHHYTMSCYESVHLYVVSLCSMLLKSHCSQHSELCSDPACSKYEVKAGARESERTHECRMQIVAPESQPQSFLLTPTTTTPPAASALFYLLLSLSGGDTMGTPLHRPQQPPPQDGNEKLRNAEVGVLLRAAQRWGYDIGLLFCS